MKMSKHSIVWEMAHNWASLHGDPDAWKDKIREAFIAGWETREKLMGSRTLDLMGKGIMEFDLDKLLREKKS